MNKIINNIVANAISSSRPKNILVTTQDAIFEYLLCKATPHTFYQLEHLKKIGQPRTQHERLITISPDVNTWPKIPFDLCICNDIVYQSENALQLTNSFHIPSLMVIHNIRQPMVKIEDIQILGTRLKNTKKVSISPKINETWYTNADIIPYGIPEEHITTSSKKPGVLLAGDFNPNDLDIIRHIKSKSPIPVTIIGNNADLSSSATFSTFLNMLKTHSIFINLFNDIEINMCMLFAMAAGCSVITHNSILNQEVVQHETNGFISKSLDDTINLIPTANYKHREIGKNAQQTIREKYGWNNFTEKYTKVIEEASKKPYIRE